MFAFRSEETAQKSKTARSSSTLHHLMFGFVRGMTSENIAGLPLRAIPMRVAG